MSLTISFSGIVNLQNLNIKRPLREIIIKDLPPGEKPDQNSENLKAGDIFHVIHQKPFGSKPPLTEYGDFLVLSVKDKEVKCLKLDNNANTITLNKSELINRKSLDMYDSTHYFGITNNMEVISY